LAGDIEKRIEQQLLDHDDLPQNIDVLLVPHHGSNTSSGSPWLRRLQPAWGVVTAGFNNPYGHPHPKVIDRYANEGIALLNTARSGAVRFTLEEPEAEANWSIEQWRLDNSRYWYED